MDCQDDFNDKMPPDAGSNPTKIAAAEKQVVKCMNSCVDRHLELLKAVQGRIETEIVNSKPR